MDTHRNPMIILVFLVSLHFSSSTSYAVPPYIIGRHKGSVLSPFGVLKTDDKGSNLVLEVSKEDYENCNTKNPIKKMDAGNSMFQFGQSGTFYIISGNQESCEKGQNFTIVVPPMTDNPYHPTLTPSRAPPKRFTPTSPPKHSPMPFSHAPKVSPPKKPISSSANTLSSSHAPVKAPTPVAHQPPSHTTRTSISPSIASKLPSSLSPTSPHALSSNISPVMSPQGSRIITSSSPTSQPAPSSNNPPVTSPQGSSNIIAPISSNRTDIPSGSPPKSSSAIVMASTPTVLLASVLSLSISVALQELFTIYH